MYRDSCFISQEIDDIITWGTHHYSKIGNTFEPKGSYRYLQVNEVCNRPDNHKNKKYNLQLVDEYFGMKSQNGNDILFETYSLINAVEMLFKASSNVMIIINSLASSISYNKGKYILFDSHRKNAEGTPDLKGGSVIEFGTTQSMAKYLQKINPESAKFDIASMIVSPSRDSSAKDKTVQVPVPSHASNMYGHNIFVKQERNCVINLTDTVICYEIMQVFR